MIFHLIDCLTSQGLFTLTAPSAFALKACGMLLQIAKLTLIEGVLHGVTVQHCNLLQTLFSPLLVLA